MQVEVHLEREADAIPWGFRLTGGADCDDVPLTVTKVVENSLAEKAGVERGDVLVKINHMHVVGLTHEEVHDLIAKCGNRFDVEINRGHWDDLPGKDETTDSQNDSTCLLEKKDTDRTNQASKKSESVTDEEIAEAIASEAEVLPQQNIIGVNFDKTDHLIESEVIQELNQQTEQQQTTVEGKKWSTFLQRPTNAMPVYKKVEFGPSAPPYKVVILKGIQPPKKQELEENQIQEILINNEPIDEDIQEHQQCDTVQNRYEIDDHQEEENDEHLLQIDHLDRISEVSERIDDLSQELDDKYHEEQEEVEELDEDKPETPLFSLQEQLSQIQTQLFSISEIPSDLQQELESVAQHLVKLIQQTQPKQADEEEEAHDWNHDDQDQDQDCSSMEAMDECETPKSMLIYDSDSERMMELLVETEVENSEEMQVSSQSEEVKRETEEELLRREQEEQERLMKHQRVEEWNAAWPWSDKTRPCYRINFLKYQPPSKNMDFLHKSEVFRLIHDAEEMPARGIASRPAFIPAEQDYRTQKPAVSG